MAIPPKMPPGMNIGESFSPSIKKANSPANKGMKSEIVAVTTAGKRFDAIAKPIVGMAVESTPRPTNTSSACPFRLSYPEGAGAKPTINARMTLPEVNVSKDTPIVSGAAPRSARIRYIQA
jgi:hypothetical protein